MHDYRQRLSLFFEEQARPAPARPTMTTWYSLPRGSTTWVAQLLSSNEFAFID